jgi:hypothetical protein
MRCPKCSYISFDHLDACQKCGRNLTEIVGQIHGTSLKVEPPIFLGSALDALAAEPAFGGGMEVVGSGLSLEDDAHISMEGDAEEAVSGSEMEASFQDEDEFDFQMDADPDAAAQGASSGKTAEKSSGQEPAGEQQEQLAKGTEGVSLDFEGLDLSDLSPEAAGEPTSEEKAEAPGSEKEESFDLWSLEESTEGPDVSDIFQDMNLAGKTPPASAPSSSDESESVEDALGGDSSEDEVT